MKYLLSILFFAFCNSLFAGGNLELTCKPKGENGKPLKQPVAILFEGGKKTDLVQSNSEGEMLFHLTTDNHYRIEITGDGYQKTSIVINTDVPETKNKFDYSCIISFELQTVSASDNNETFIYVEYLAAKDGFGRVEKLSSTLKSDFTGKILADKKPLINQKIHIKDGTQNIIQTCITDIQGNFLFKEIPLAEKCNIEIEPNKELEGKKVVLARQDGYPIGNFTAGKNGILKFELLPFDIPQITMLEEKDVSARFISMQKFNDKEILLEENIYYESGKWEILPEAAIKLNNVIKLMQENPNYLVEIISHTDSKGDAKTNKELSEKRAADVSAYFISKGIEKSKIKYKGMGENNILNHCSDGNECTETEHKLNRRTEFRFIKI
jgi:outer membrane protein OmpA-like peptidoglycan-associated protein